MPEKTYIMPETFSGFLQKLSIKRPEDNAKAIMADIKDVDCGG